jgi:predicted nuclease of predicted toxin-antitoxin system
VNFLVDAQLPKRLAVWISRQGHDAKHTLELPLGNRTPDQDIVMVADREDRAVVTKDGDFAQSFLVNGRPKKLLLVSTGNITNAELERLIKANFKEIVQAFEQHQYVELGRTLLAVHQ